MTKFRAMVRLLSFDRSVQERSCDNHTHSSPQTAAQCGQRRLRGYLSHANGKANRIRYIATRTDVLRQEEGGEWVVHTADGFPSI